VKEVGGTQLIVMKEEMKGGNAAKKMKEKNEERE
jgi:hypothetical protein